jgi:hypothetical protein
MPIYDMGLLADEMVLVASPFEDPSGLGRVDVEAIASGGAVVVREKGYDGDSQLSSVLGFGVEAVSLSFALKKEDVVLGDGCVVWVTVEQKDVLDAV